MSSTTFTSSTKSTVSPVGKADPAGSTKPLRGSEGRLSSVGANELVCGLLAGGATLTVYRALVPQIADTFVGDLMLHGPVSQAIVFVTTWAAFLVAGKALAALRQRRSLGADVLPTHLGHEVREDNAELFLEHLDTQPDRIRSSLLGHRVELALEHLRAHGDPAQLPDVLSAQAAIDAAHIESSYGMLRTFIWAVPILGFAGTVIGVGDAVSSLSHSMALGPDSTDLQSALGGAMSGLGDAFSTTLAGLLASMLLMIPTELVRKLDDGVLTVVASLCNRTLLKRVRGGVDTTQDGVDAALQSLYTENARAQAAWRADLVGIGQQLSEDVASGWRQANGEMRTLAEQQLEVVQDAITEGLRGPIQQVGDWVQELRSQEEARQKAQAQRWEQLSGVVMDQGQQGLTAMRSAADQLSTTLTEQCQQGVAAMQTAADRLEAWQEEQARAQREQSKQLKVSHEAVISTVQEAPAAMLAHMAEREAQHAAKLEELTASVAAAIDSLEQRLRDSVTDHATATSQGSAALQSASASLDALAQRTAAVLDDTKEAVVAGLDHALGRQADALAEQTLRCRQLGQVQLKLAKQLHSIAQDGGLVAAIQHLESVLAEVAGHAETNGRSHGFGRFFRRNGHALSGRGATS